MMKNKIIALAFGLFETKLTALFDKFRVSSPKIALMVFTGLAAISAGANTLLSQPEAFALLGSYAPVVNTSVTVISMILAALTGTASTGQKSGDILIPGTKTTFPVKEKIKVKAETGSITDQIGEGKFLSMAETKLREEDMRKQEELYWGKKAAERLKALIESETAATKKKHWKKPKTNVEKKEI